MSPPPLQPRSKGASVFMAMPIVLASLLLISIAALAGLVWIGGSADGERVEMRFTSACGERLNEVLPERVAAIGLGDPQFVFTPTSVQITATLPGLADDTVHIPGLLARQGILSIVANDTTLATEADLEKVAIEIDESSAAYLQLVLKPVPHAALQKHIAAHPAGKVSISIDNVWVVDRPNSKKLPNDELRIVVESENNRERMQSVTDHMIALRYGPIPCPVTVSSVKAIHKDPT